MATWVLLGIALLAWWRWIERRSGVQMPGPVTIEFTGCARPKPSESKPAAGKPDGSKPADAPSAPTQPSGTQAGEADPDADAQRAEFRAAVLTNLAEPGAVPGSETTFPVTDLAELATSAAGLLTVPS